MFKTNMRSKTTGRCFNGCGHGRGLLTLSWRILFGRRYGRSREFWEPRRNERQNKVGITVRTMIHAVTHHTINNSCLLPIMTQASICCVLPRVLSRLCTHRLPRPLLRVLRPLCGAIHHGDSLTSLWLLDSEERDGQVAGWSAMVEQSERRWDQRVGFWVQAGERELEQKIMCLNVCQAINTQVCCRLVHFYTHDNIGPKKPMNAT